MQHIKKRVMKKEQESFLLSKKIIYDVVVIFCVVNVSNIYSTEKE